MAQDLIMIASVMMGVLVVDALEQPILRARRALRERRGRRDGR